MLKSILSLVLFLLASCTTTNSKSNLTGNIINNEITKYENELSKANDELSKAQAKAQLTEAEVELNQRKVEAEAKYYKAEVELNRRKVEAEKIYLREIENGETLLAEWGTATASSLLYSYDKSDKFKIELDNTAKYYFENAKKSKSAGLSFQKQMALFIALAGSKKSDFYQNQLFHENLLNYEENKKKIKENEINNQKNSEEYNNHRRELNKLEKENYLFCQSTSDEMLSSAMALDSVAQREEKNKALNEVVDYRNNCLKNYTQNIHKIASDSTDIANNYPSLSNTGQSEIKSQLDDLKENRPKLVDLKDLKSNNLSNSGYEIPDHEALKQMASNFWLQKILETLGDQEKQTSEIRFAVSMISVNPGWRTKKGYKAQINILGDFKYQLADEEFVDQFIDNKKIPIEERIVIAKSYRMEKKYQDLLKENKEGNKIDYKLLDCKEYDMRGCYPSSKSSIEITAISPTSMGQNMDLDSSYQRDWMMSLSLAQTLKGIGAEEQAEVFTEYAKRQQGRAASVSTRNEVNVYSYGNRLTGVEVSPSFRASDYRGRNSTNGTMEQQSFPVLFIEKLKNKNKNNLERYILFKNCSDEYPHCLYQPYRSISVSHRWVPIKKHKLSFLGYMPKQLKSKKIRSITKVISGCVNYPKSEFLASRCRELLAKLGGVSSSRGVEITSKTKEPKPKTPSVLSIFPSEINIMAKNNGDFNPVNRDFVIVGKNLNLIDTDDSGPIIEPLFKSGISITSRKLENGYIKLSASIDNKIKNPIMFNLKHENKWLTTASLPSENGRSKVVIKKESQPVEPPNVKYINVDGKKITWPTDMTDLPNNISITIQSLYGNNCKSIEDKEIVIGKKSIKIPKGFCDLYGNSDAIKTLLEFVKQK